MSDDTDTTATLPQGDLRLLDTPVAVHLLASATPARLAYVAEDGTPRVVPTWFHWNGEELVMPTFVAAPHIRRPARRIASLRANPAVALSIDTDGSPPHVLLVRGEATVEDIDGVFREPLPRITLDSLPDTGAWLPPFRSLRSLLESRR